MKHYCPGGVHWHIGFFELIIWRLSGISHLANENGSGDYFHLFVTRLSSIFFTGDCYFEFETYVRKFFFGLNFAIKTKNVCMDYFSQINSFLSFRAPKWGFKMQTRVDFRKIANFYPRKLVFNATLQCFNFNPLHATGLFLYPLKIVAFLMF